MHTKEFKTSHGSTVAFIHHGDYSGDVTIVGADGRSVIVPCDLVTAFVAEIVRAKKLQALEQADAVEILGLER